MRGVPDNIISLMDNAEKAYQLPKGTLFAIMQTEVGGQLDKYLNAPETYHYGLNNEGKRIATHTGKISTAFGPFGILESTAKQPGYGVTPLKDKSIGEQIRFSAEYLAKKSKHLGSFNKGLSSYGEGDIYANKVLKKMGQAPVDTTSPVDNTQSPSPSKPVFTPPLPIDSTGNPQDAWGEFKRAYTQTRPKESIEVNAPAQALLTKQLASIGQQTKKVLNDATSQSKQSPILGGSNTPKKGLWGWVV